MKQEVKAGGLFLLSFFGSLALVLLAFDLWLRSLLEEAVGR